jgi:hypothetical protein
MQSGQGPYALQLAIAWYGCVLESLPVFALEILCCKWLLLLLSTPWEHPRCWQHEFED